MEPKLPPDEVSKGIVAVSATGGKGDVANQIAIGKCQGVEF
jgi:hypothetical protein